jgi:hypothetical protein
MIVCGGDHHGSTAQTLTLANLLNNYQQDLVSAHYIDLIRIYARSHHRTQSDGSIVPWIDESLHPDTSEWVTGHVVAPE